MKKFFLIVMFAVAAMAGMAQTIGEAFYIYRNDGQINGFVRSDIDSITYSYYSVDSVRYDEIVTQIVYTNDSIFRIPLSSVDSVSFVTPKTTYQPGVVNLSDELMPYIVSCDSLTLTFSSTAPVEKLPKVGDKLVTTEMNDIFPIGFAGMVTAVHGNSVVCSRVALEDVFETYYNVASVYGYVEDGQAARRRAFGIEPIDTTVNKDFQIHTITIPLNSEISRAVKPNSDLALKGGSGFSVEITPTFHVHAMLIMNKQEGTYFQARVSGDLNIKEKLTVYGGIEWTHDFDNLPLLSNLKIERPICPYVTFFFQPGLFLRASAVASASIVASQDYTFAWGRDWSTKGKNNLKPSAGGHRTGSSVEVEGCFDGSIAGGGYVEIGLALLHSKLDNISLRGEVGAEFVSHAVLYNSDIEAAEKGTGVYERFKQSSFDLNAFVSTSCNLQLVGGLWGVSYPLPWNLSHNIKSWDMVPTFSDTKFKQCMNPSSSADASTKMSGECLFPVIVGQSVRNKNMEEVDGYWDETKFDHGNHPLNKTFTNLSDTEDYTLYPKVRIFGYTMLGAPSAKLERTEMPVEITDFKQTGSHYSKDGYSHEGKTYFYQYDCSVTVVLKNGSNVEDWGYVYEDPYGQQARISLKSFGSNYTDTRYVYYRNESSSTVCLYEFVKFKDNPEYYYGEKKDYNVLHSETSCPDHNHPHMINLGLPSGTLWACCNVGASAPEDYGNYYAWGETQPKSVYNFGTYQYYNGNLSYPDCYIYIGSDIAGTSYDAATANWGAPWRMPSLTQIQELLNYTTSTGTTENGVNGRKFTGSNGGSIFFPAAGDRWNSDLRYAGSRGNYWSSTLDGSNPYNAYDLSYDLYFGSGDADWHSSFYRRSDGHSVRPVR